MVNPQYDRNHPFLAQIVLNRKLTRFGSAKDTRHLEFAIDSKALPFEPGDSLGVWPSNEPVLVDKLITINGLEANDTVLDENGTPWLLKNFLANRCDLQKVTPRLLPALQKNATHPRDQSRLENWSHLDNKDHWREEHMDVLDVLEQLPFTKLNAQELVNVLGRLTPRLYSISSSLLAHPDRLHLTVTVETTEHKNRIRMGVASTHLSWRSGTEERLPLFVHEAKHFHLPESGDVPIIMVGPGTGIAPFRSFLQEREALGALGKNWLFFGEQRRTFDFLYEDELLHWQKTGLLTRLNTAFSRDQEEKIYVQHRIWEERQEIWKWLNEGAYFYMCGDARRMAKDVDATLLLIAQECGQLSAEAALEYFKVMKKEKRYLKDVY